MPSILQISNLGKKFRISHNRGGYLSFRETLLQRLTSASRQSEEEFWALKDVSFDVEQGESIGIVGNNGAGKSTLLKILSKITPPTTGKIITRGRIASLLEVGTGFHPELTGRENIFFNGSLLGMRKHEIQRKFDEIVDFSGTERFLDTPLKHYSSGMQLRLAFAVAAHLEPEILIVDEVLAVGDAEFQQRCMGKMEQVTKEKGRTILFVSHNMAAIRSLCSRAFWLNKGSIAMTGTATEVTSAYLAKGINSSGSIAISKPSTYTVAFVTHIQIEHENMALTKVVPLFRPFSISIDVTIVEPIKHFIIGLGMSTIDGTPVRTVWTKPIDVAPGVYRIKFEERTIEFCSGKYRISVGLSSREQLVQYVADASILEFEKTFDKAKVVNSSLGVILNQMEFSIQQIP
jgi:lipopolysaccharide transport system ATP-binding protein